MPTQDIYEESTLRVRIRLQGQSKSATLDGQLILIKNGVEQPPQDIEVKKQWAEVTHTFARVDYDKERYTLAFKVTCATESAYYDTTFTVWPHNCVVTVEDGAGNPQPNTPFLLRFTNGAVQRHESDGAGQCDCRLLQKATFGIGPVPRYRSLDPQPGFGRARTVNLKELGYTCTIESPAAAGVIKQYVNLSSVGVPVGHDGQGRSVAIHLLGVPTDDGDIAALVRPGDRYFLKMTLRDLTRRTTERITLEGVQGLTSSTNYLNHTAQVPVGADGRATFGLKLGVGGNEKCVIEVGTTSDCVDARIEFHALRKVFTKQYLPPGFTAIDLTDAKGAFAEVGIELEELDNEDVPDISYPPGTRHPSAEVGFGTDGYLIGTHNIRQLTANLVPPPPLCAGIIHAHVQVDGRDDKGRMSVSKTVTLKRSHSVNFPGKGTVRGTTIDFNADKRVVLASSAYGDASPVSGFWKSLAADGTHKGKKGPLAPDDVSINYTDFFLRNKVRIALPQAAADVVNAGEKVSVSVSVSYVEGPYLGWAPDNYKGVVIATRSKFGGSAISSAEINKTVVHEIGHLLRQAPRYVEGGLDYEADHGYTYEERGHSGNHCATGVPAPMAHGTGRLDRAAMAFATCTMFGSAALRQRVNFCHRCRPFVSAYKVAL